MTRHPLPATADCVIVGGGVVGCSLAYHLAAGGMRPLLLERAELGAGSTVRCAGGVRQQFSTAANVRVSMLSRRLLERFEEEIGTTPAYRPIGYLFLASTEEQAAQLRRNVALQQATGLDDVELVDVDRIAELVPDVRVDDLRLGSLCPSDGLAGPSEVTHGYAGAARRHGAVIVEGCAVEEVVRDGGRVTGVRAAAGRLVATPLVIDCAGPHAATVGRMAGIEVPVLPFRRHVFVTEHFETSRPLPMTVDMATTFYSHPEGEGLLLGMSDPDEPSSFDTNVAWAFLERLIEVAVHRIPILDRAAIRTGWAGLYEVSPDHQAIVGPSEVEGFWLCCGFSGHGFMQAPAMGRLLATQILGGVPEIDLAPFDPGRFVSGAIPDPELSVI